MSKKWSKLPRGMTFDMIREKLREYRRKKEFVRKLKYGAKVVETTDDPGPY